MFRPDRTLDSLYVAGLASNISGYSFDISSFSGIGIKGCKPVRGLNSFGAKNWVQSRFCRLDNQRANKL